MTDLRFDRIGIRMADLGPESSVPPIFRTENIQQRTKSKLDEEDGVFVGYGFLNDVFPYRKQDRYAQSLREAELPAGILENEYLKAVFLPTLGARLWQLYDKQAGRNLLLTNDEIAFGNLAVRDAWFCGGVEWNFGVVGHSPFTCAPVFAATLHTDDGTPVARFYEYERIRGCTYQVDCWLPSGSDRLFVGVRLVNPNETVVPTYWWSNMAVEEIPGARVVVPASEAYTMDGDAVVKKRKLQTPGQDVTYPMQIPHAADHFWRTKDAPRKFIAYLDREGYGLCQTSSSMQLGRKLFVWGQGHGGDHWQKLLRTGGATGHYVELQAGLGQTQYECIPMPPNTAWSWVESYGAIRTDPERIHGAYAQAKACVDEIVSGYDMEAVCRNASHMKRPAETVLLQGSGWGALEAQFRQGRELRPLSRHLSFGTPGAEQCQWVHLLEEGTLGQHDPAQTPESWMLHEGFTELLEQAIRDRDRDNWYTYLQLGVIRHAEGKPEEACRLLERSIQLCENAWAHYALACAFWKLGDRQRAVQEATKSVTLKNSDVSLVRAALAILEAAKEPEKISRLIEALPEDVRADASVRLSQAMAYLALGETEKAEQTAGDDPLIYAGYVREGNIGPTTFWLELQRQKRGLSDRKELMDQIPQEWDFRMG